MTTEHEKQWREKWIEYEKTIEYQEGFIWIARNAWFAACQSMQAEVDKLVKENAQLKCAIDSYSGQQEIIEQLEAELAKTQSLLDEAVELLKWLYEREEHINEVNNAVENFIRKYEGQKGE